MGQQPCFTANPDNFRNLLSRLQDGDTVFLEEGEYKGPFEIDKSLCICGDPQQTVIFSTDEPALCICAPNVHIQNLHLIRTIGGIDGELVLIANNGCVPSMENVRCLGRVQDATWKNQRWELPDRIDFGEIENGRIFESSISVHLGEPSSIESDHEWVQVQPKMVMPGSQELSIRIDTVDIPPGTNLLTSIRISSNGVIIPVSAKVVPRKIADRLENVQSENDVAQIWGYQLIGESTVDKLLIHFQVPEQNYNTSSYADKQKTATAYLQNELKRIPRKFFLRNLGIGRSADEINVEMSLDHEDSGLDPDSHLLSGYVSVTLKGALNSTNQQPLRIFAVSFSKNYRPSGDGFTCPYLIQLVHDPGRTYGVPIDIIEKISEQPLRDQLLPGPDQIAVWDSMLKIEQNIAESRQFTVSYHRHNFGIATSRVTFEILPESGRNAVQSQFPVKDLQQRLKRAINDLIHLIRHSELVDDRSNGILLGSIDSYDPDRNMIKIKLEEGLKERILVDPNYLPQTGNLSYNAYGDIAQIKRKRNALADFNKGRFQNPNLSVFFFNASQARLPDERTTIKTSDLLLPHANAEQIESVETVLSSPDMVLIQGPPGTGKTTVIAEICFQVARRGGKTLIASQANLAVDNALSRLIHHPIIRALRRGKAERVEEEGLPFLEDNVIETWLQNTSSDCESRLRRSENNIQIFKQLLESSELFDAYLKTEQQFNSKTKKLVNDIHLLESNIKNRSDHLIELNSEFTRIKSLHDQLSNLTLLKHDSGWNCTDTEVFVAEIRKFITSTKLDSIFRSSQKIEAYCRVIEIDIPVKSIIHRPFWFKNLLPSMIEQFNQDISFAMPSLRIMKEFLIAVNILNSFKDKSKNLINQIDTIKIEVNRLEFLAAGEETKKKDIRKIREILDAWRERRIDVEMNILNKASRNLGITTSELPVPEEILSLTHRSEFSLQVNWEQWIKELVSDINDRIRREKEIVNAISKAEKIKNRLSTHTNDISKVSPLQIENQTALYRKKYSANEEVQQYMVMLDQDTMELHRQLTTEKSIFDIVFSFMFGDRKTDDYAKLAALIIILDELLKKIQSRNELRSEIRDSICSFYRRSYAKTEQALNEEDSRLNERMHNINKKLYLLKKEIKTITEELNEIKHSSKPLTHDLAEKKASVKQLLNSLCEKLPAQHIISKSARRCLVEELDNDLYFQEFIQKVELCQQTISNLGVELTLLNPEASVQEIAASLHRGFQKITIQISETEKEAVLLKEKLCVLKTKYEKFATVLESQRSWWEKTWQAIPRRLIPEVVGGDIFNIAYLEKIRDQFRYWQIELDSEEQYLLKYQKIVNEWIARLRNPTRQDQVELKTIYLENANVIGITCSQAASRFFSESFKMFDVVIIDEVSKCTPPELLIPALKGKKIVMVGDYRQLPPMFQDETIEEIAETLGYSSSDLHFIKDSLFKMSFEFADPLNKVMLKRQYRMHPVIMNAINQFYDNRLICGIADPETTRRHGVEDSILQSTHHLVWVTIPIGKEYGEKQDGTSFSNQSEVDAIIKLCSHMNDSWNQQMKKDIHLRSKEVGIITFYMSQLKLIETELEQHLFPALKIRTGTVDRFQGMEKPIVIVSMVRNNNRGNIGFASKTERVNVAFSRAQELLVIVGCHELFVNSRSGAGDAYRNVSDVVRKHGGFVHVSDL